MAPILRRQLRKSEQQTSDTGVSEVNLMRYAEMKACAYTTTTPKAGARSDGPGGCSTRCLCASTWAYSQRSRYSAGTADIGHALQGQTQAWASAAISKEDMSQQELLRYANVRFAFDIPRQTVARAIQKDLAGAHAPAKASYFHIPKAGSHHRSQRIAKAAI